MIFNLKYYYIKLKNLNIKYQISNTYLLHVIKK